MNPLTAETLRGVWSALLMCWDEHDRFDEATFAENVRRIIRAGVDGVYTTGSAGEFYAISDDEFQRMVDAAAAVCAETGTPLQIGCCADATWKTRRLIEQAAAYDAVSGVQVCLPYWMELTDEEILAFFRALHETHSRMPLIHYNVPRAKRFLLGPEYRRILDEAAPNLVGVKFTGAGGHFGALQSALRLTPELSYFVGEPLLASAMQLGARGCYSSLVNAGPRFMRRYYEHAAAGEWDQAIEMQQHLDRFFADWFALIEAHGERLIDPVADKGLAVAAGSFRGHQRCRRPHKGWSNGFVKTLRAWLQRHYPEFVFENEE